MVFVEGKHLEGEAREVADGGEDESSILADGFADWIEQHRAQFISDIAARITGRPFGRMHARFYGLSIATG